MRSLLLTLVIALLAVPVFGQNCPVLTVDGPPGFTRPGELMRFSATIDTTAQIRFHWTVDRGTIVSGQETPSIVVQTTAEDDGKIVEAKVVVSGLSPFCGNTAEATGPVDVILHISPSDQWNDDIKLPDLRARLDSFLIELMNNPTHIGEVVIITGGREPEGADEPQIRAIVRQAKFRKFDPSRLVFRVGRGDRPITTLWRLVPGQDGPYKDIPEVTPTY